MNIKNWNIVVTMNPPVTMMTSTLGEHNARHYYHNIKVNYDSYIEQMNVSLKIVLTGRSNETFDNLEEFRNFLEEHELIESNCLGCTMQ